VRIGREMTGNAVPVCRLAGGKTCTTFFTPFGKPGIFPVYRYVPEGNDGMEVLGMVRGRDGVETSNIKNQTSRKHQDPSSKHQRSSKHQAPKSGGHG
jgi:hypothetical protein